MYVEGLCACVLYMSFDVCAGFIGYADTIAKIISDHPVQDRDDDQLYYTKLYLDQEKRVWVDIYCQDFSIYKLLSHGLINNLGRIWI